MKPSEIEPGMLLKGHFGQVREVVWARGIKCGYRQLSNGSVTGKGLIEIGKESDPISRRGLAEWTEEDVTESYRLPGRKPFAFKREVA